MRNSGVNGLLIIALSWVAGGCSSMRFSTTLQPQPDPGPVFGEARFCINEVKVKDDRAPVWFISATGPNTTAPMFNPGEVVSLRATAEKLYPSIFSDDVLSIPLTVSVDRANQSTPDFLLFIFPGLLGWLPVYEGRASDYTVCVSTPAGNAGSAPVKFTRHDAAWTTILHPLALFPVVGHSSIPRRSWAGASMPEDVIQTGKNLTYGSLSEAVRRQVSSLDGPLVFQSYNERTSRLQTFSIQGRSLWLWCGYLNEELHVWVFAERPTYSKWTPLDDIVFHPNSDKTYSPVLMRKPPYFTEISVGVDLGKIVMKAQSVTPALSSLLALVDPNAGGALALDDDALVAAITQSLVCGKNTELPTLIVQAPLDKRVALMSAIEQRLLEAQQHLVVLNGQAEDAVRQGQNAAGFRQKSARIQAYMAVLSEIKNLLMQS